MTWRQVARKDLNDAIRARWLWILSVLTILAFSAPIVFEAYLEIGRLLVATYTDNPTQMLLTYSRAVGPIVVPLIALVLSYAAITRERDSGSIKLLLSLPHSRRDIVIGKFLGRCGAVAVPVLVSLIAGAVLLFGVDGLLIRPYAVFAFATLLFTVTITGIGVGLSARLDTTRRAILASITALALFLVFWAPFAGFVSGAIQGLLSVIGVDVAATTAYSIDNVLTLANPLEAYKDLLAPFSIRASVAQQYPGKSGAPIYLEAPFSILVMVLWTVGAVVFGSRHFERVDL